MPRHYLRNPAEGSLPPRFAFYMASRQLAPQLKVPLRQAQEILRHILACQECMDAVDGVNGMDLATLERYGAFRRMCPEGQKLLP